MARRRFFASPKQFAPDGATIALEADEARHLRDVLRLNRGDEVFVFDGQGREFRCVIEDIGREGATLNVVDEVEPERPESSLQLTLAVALLKGEKFDLVVQKATELGVQRIMPVVTKRADVRLRDGDDEIRRVVRWQRIAQEACKQSGRAGGPEINRVITFASLIESAPSDTGEWRVMFAERGGDRLLEKIKNFQAQPVAVTALIGSEGGWTDEEIKLAQDAGWSIVTLGGRTLRAETAAIAVTALLQHAFGDLV